ncbi:hypothetical protein CDD82_623 [Ophiocordyceps australis]|uniref:Uncharacterized protein n=1 Tax=Ophiocordyceps australis TaxID=1399860 RepID=A0A2C5XDE8_9HYPO|nr:hypothetical protein CDD82_623 [Ophiocordyceps australis]
MAALDSANQKVDTSDEESFGAFSSDGDLADDTSDQDSAGPHDKDSDEEELERLVLGDETSFKNNLFKHAPDFELVAEDKGQATKDDASGLEGVDDADLFVLDTAREPGGAATLSKSKDEQGPVWHDSDDDRLTISLVSVSRLRKLRITETEDVVSGTEYCKRLRQQYRLLNPVPEWAKQAEERASKKRRRSSVGSQDDSSNDDDDDDDDVDAQPLESFLRDVNRLAGLGGPKRRALRPEIIDIQRTREIPDRHRRPVASLCFHPEFPVLLSASSSSILHLHHIAPDANPPNPQLTSVQAKYVDVRRAEFLYPHGNKIFFAGRRAFFHNWDLPSGIVQKTTKIQGCHRLEVKSMERFRLSPCGRYMAVAAPTNKGGGVINVLSVATTQWIAAARLQSTHGIADFAWWNTGDGITILGRDGLVGEYSVASRAFVGLWHDDGCINGKVVALGGRGGPVALGEDRWVAVGSASGIANIYDRQELVEAAKTKSQGKVVLKDRPVPKRVLEQLVTPITVLTFSPDGQLLAFGSQAKMDALRLVHLPSCTVYRNWPTGQTPLGRITAVAFGRKSDMLAVGNDAGKIRLWNIRN